MSSRHPRPSPGGRHELGQNFLVDRRIVRSLVERIGAHPGPVLELAAGEGALTLPLAAAGRRVVAVEIDPARAAALERRAPRGVDVLVGDVLELPWPREPHVVAGNLPFHLTTPIMRRLLEAPAWTAAVLLVQWEVARRRAGVGGATLLTAQWWPCFEFELVARVPAEAFRPRPGVDGGILEVRRREKPLVDELRGYQGFVARAFRGRGGTLRQLARRELGVPPKPLRRWEQEHAVSPGARPKDLRAEQWAALWELSPRRARP